MRTLHSILVASSIVCTIGNSFAASAASETTEDFTIRPGIGIGDLRIGMTEAQLQNKLGKYDGTYSMPHGIKGAYSQWKETNSVSTLRAFFDSSGKVIQLACEHSGAEVPTKPNDRRLATTDGVYAGSNFTDVSRKYNPLQRLKYRAKDGRIDYYDNVKRGIAFEFTWAETEGESKQRLYAIIVHAPGKSVIADADERPVNR